jgi:hypothetical protein
MASTVAIWAETARNVEAVIDTREPVGSQGSGKVVYAVWSSMSVRWGSRAWWRLAAAMLAWPSRRRA